MDRWGGSRDWIKTQTSGTTVSCMSKSVQKRRLRCGKEKLKEQKRKENVWATQERHTALCTGCHAS